MGQAVHRGCVCVDDDEDEDAMVHVTTDVICSRGDRMLNLCEGESVDDSEFFIGISSKVDYVGMQDGKRYVKIVEEDVVHGSTFGKIKSMARRPSKHGQLPSPEAEEFACEIVDRAKEMAEAVAMETVDAFDNEWKLLDGQDPLAVLLGEHDTEELAKKMQDLCVELQQHVATAPVLNRASLPAKVYGDIHGQLRDLLLFLHHYGFPAQDGPDYIFNGDWVDRGAHQLEVLSLIYALKLAYPDKVFLNRGNHEDHWLNEHMGSMGLVHKCLERWPGEMGKAVYKTISASFEYLPLATIAGSRIFVVHGGIGDGQWLLGHIDGVKRPLTSEDLPLDPILYNLLWSDPIGEDQANSFGVHGSPRDNHAGLTTRFGHDVTEKFLNRNRLGMIIRSHESEVGGHGYDVMHGGKLVRVFTARDYEEQGNDGSILTIDVLPDRKRIMVRPQLIHSLAKVNQGLLRQ